MVDIQTISFAVASASVTLAAFYYVWQIRNQTRIRKTDMVIELSQTATSKEFSDAKMDILELQFKDYEDYRKKYSHLDSESNREIIKSYWLVIGFYDLVGMLLLLDLVDLQLVYDVFGLPPIQQTYEKTRPVIMGMRRDRNEPDLCIGLEYLYNELMRKHRKLRKDLLRKARLQIGSRSNRSKILLVL